MDQEPPPYEQSEKPPDASDKHVSKELTLALSNCDYRHALVILTREHGNRVYNYCRRLLRDEHAAEDAQQEIFAFAYQHMSRLQHPSKIQEWLFTIAHNYCLSVLRKKTHEAKHLSMRDPPPEVASPEQPPDEGNDSQYALKSLNECIEQLAPEARYTVLLRYQEERLLTYEEMGRICRARPTALQNRVVRALPLLKRCLKGKGVAL